MQKKEKHKNFANVKLFELPIGKLFSHRSFVAKDSVSQAGIREIEQLITEKEGLSIFFAHLGLLDVFGTAVAVEKSVDYKAVFPVAASWYYFPLLLKIFRRVEKQVPHEFIPVFRREEFEGLNHKIKFLDFSGLDERGKKQANHEYVEHTKEVQDQGGVIMLAPYGGRAPLMEFFRSGPVSLMQEGGPIIFSLTAWNWKKLKYEVFFSQTFRFTDDITKEQAHKVIYGEFLRMAKLSHVSETDMLHSKSGTPVSRNLWKVMATLISTYMLFFSTSTQKNKKK